LVEECLGGRKFTVAIMEHNGYLTVVPVEIITPQEDGVRIPGSKVKNNNTEVLKKITNTNILSEVIYIAEKSFCALGARDFWRIDVRMNDRGKCNFIEAYLFSGMTKGSSYLPCAYKLRGDLDYNEVLNLVT